MRRFVTISLLVAVLLSACAESVGPAAEGDKLEVLVYKLPT